jgi:rhodanese-related sulfurtransferase
VFLTILLCFFLTSCSTPEEEIIEILPDDLITMMDLDNYMFRDDVQYVDLRNYESHYRSGYIDSFEQIPFFDYLDYRVFNRRNTYEFDPSQLVNENELYRLFDQEKAIFLYADGCVRSGYVKDALNYLGYERVYVLGGFMDYEGEHKVLGDGSYQIGSTFYATRTDLETGITFHIYGLYDIDRMITSIRIDMIDSNGVSLRSPNYDVVIDYNQQLTILESFIISDVTTMNDLYENISDNTSYYYTEITSYNLGFSEGLTATFERLISK